MLVVVLEPSDETLDVRTSNEDASRPVMNQPEWNLHFGSIRLERLKLRGEDLAARNRGSGPGPLRSGEKILNEEAVRRRELSIDALRALGFSPTDAIELEARRTIEVLR